VKLSLIAALAKNHVIGHDNQLPWHLPEDLKHFKKTTLGKPVIMGRKTFESIGRPLPGRRNLVLTRSTSWSEVHADLETFSSLEDALKALRNTPEPPVEVFVIGGGEIYRQALPLAHRMVLTRVEMEIEGDTTFPTWSSEEFHRVSARRVESGGTDMPAFTFEEYTREF